MKNILDGLPQGVLLFIVGGLITFVGPKFLHSNLEYTVTSTDAYLSAPLGQQGLTIAFGGKPLKNVSIVEFSILNRTPKQFKDAELEFFTDKKAGSALVSSDIIPPRRISKKENVENLTSKDPNVRRFRLKIVPTQQDNEYFNAVFVFTGEKAPHMSVISKTGEVSLVQYEGWKDSIIWVTIFLLSYLLLGLYLLYRVDFIWAPKGHQKRVKRFEEYVKQFQSDGKLNTDPQFLADTSKVFTSFTKPKPYKFWSKILPERHFKDKP
jgi:hypothetical protein